jgi:hypothetical protein
MHRYYVFIFLVFTAVVSASAQFPETFPSLLATVQPDSIRSHIQYLADDKLLGRYPGTPGYQMAMDYVIANYKKIGVTPAGDDGTYLQKIKFRNATMNPNTTKVLFTKQISSIQFVANKDIVVLPHYENIKSNVNASLVFVGYGISAPEAGYDDYAGLDVKGKIVVIVRGAPDTFEGTIRAHSMSRSTIITTAISKGAVGVIERELNNVAIASMAQTVIGKGLIVPLAKNGKMFQHSSRGGGGMGLNFYGLISLATFNQIVNLNDDVLSDRLLAMKNGKPASFELEGTISAEYESSYKDFESYNVVGVLKGSDNKLKDEYLVYSAHLDHMGVSTPVKGDSIYNGAHDNASGVACVTEVARLFSKVKTKRSVIFVMVVGEEMGLLGSSYFATFPTVPKDKIVADVNMDMPTIIAPLLSVVPLGAAHSSLMKEVKAAANYLQLSVEEDPEPDQNRFIRSDQYSFVQQGIPALHIKYGEKTTVPGKKLSDQVKIWRAEIYHHPQDELATGTFDFEAGKKYVQLCFLIGYQVAQGKSRPKWNKHDFFGRKFSK